MKFDYTIFMVSECDAETSSRIFDASYALMKEKSGAPYGMMTNKTMEMITHEKHEADSERA